MRTRILAIVTALIVYGSLYPFHFALPASHGEAWHKLLFDWTLFTSRGDVLGNLALFIPFGFAGAFAMRGRERDVPPGWAIALASFVLATAVQIAQIYFPGRNPAIADVIWNMLGTAFGIAAGWFLSGRIRLPGVHWRDAYVLPVALFALWIAAELLPLVPSLDLQALKDSARALMRPSLSLADVAVHAAGAAVAGWALTALLGETLAMRALVALAAAVAAGKLLVVTQVLDASTVAGLGAGCAAWIAIARQRESRRIESLLGLLAAACVLRALAPFELRSEPGTFNLVPFAGLLSGSMLANSKALAMSVFLYAAIFALMRANRAAIAPVAVAVAVLVTLLEVVQMYLVGRSADITEPLLALMAGWLIHLAPSAPAGTTAPPVRSPPRPQPRPRPDPPADSHRTWQRPGLAWALYLAAACVVLALAAAMVLRLPRIPYNVKELFLGNGAFPFLVIFALAVLWTGFAPRLIGARLAGSQRPWLALPLLAFGAGVVSLLLLCASVTQESIADIAGTTNLYWFVINKNLWGSWARNLFAAIGSDIVSFFERPVRYAALYGPLVTFLALMFACVDLRGQRGLPARHAALLAVSAVLWLWLCKAIAFDWSSTDNLNELIARDGPWGWGGGGYLYLLLALICANAVLLATMPLRPAPTAVAVAVTIAALPLGWVLLNEGLEQQVHKYSQVFSGVQFLLGPDRKQGLGTEVLFARWCAVQLAGVLVMAAGARLAAPLTRQALRRQAPRKA